MEPQRWDRLEALFHEAVAKPAAERAAFLDSLAAADPQLARDLQAMLDEDGRSASVLDRGVAAAAGRALDAPPTAVSFGPYRMQRVLGEGGMGVVFLASHRDLDRLVAVKVLRDAWMSPARRERFAAEQRLLARLTHPSIARLYDAETLPDGAPCIVMEYVDGLPLTGYCAARQSAVPERLRLLRDVCEAVRYAHSRAVIHRDLKPSNILVQDDGAVKLLDFGIAKQLDRDEAAADRTRTGLRLLTPAYAAPEQLRGEPAGAYTDVYALGVILYELLAGRLPSGPESGGPPTPPARDPDLNVLCLTAMHSDVERRYASVEAFVRDIDHFLAGEPLEARPDTLRYRASKFVRRNRRAVASVACLGLAVTALIVFYTIRLAAARNDALAEAARAQRVLKFTLSLFNGGSKEAGPAQDLRVSGLLDRGLAEAARLNRDPVVQTDLYDTLGVVYQQLGDFHRADELLQSVLARRRASPEGTPAKVADSLMKLALLRLDQARLDEAQQHAAEALALVKRSLPADHPTFAAATHTWGRVLEERGSYDQALQFLDDAVRLRSAPGADPADLAESLLELAACHFYAGHYPESEALNRRLLDMHRGLYGDRHPLLAEDLVNLGAIQQELGNYAEAEKFHRKALEITQAFYGKEHYKTASNLTLIARAVTKQDRHDEALVILEQALAIQEKVFGSVHPRVASALNEVANVALMKDRYDEAEAAFRRMVEVYRAVHSGKHFTIGIGLANIGSVYMARRQEAPAEALFREALAMYAQTLPPEHLNIAITKIKLGRVLLRQNRFAEAEKETLAGYETLSRQANPAVTFLRAARADLAAIYTALKQPERARAFEAPLAAAARK